MDGSKQNCQNIRFPSRDALQSANDMWNYDSYDENKRSLSNHALPTANCIAARTVLVDAVGVAVAVMSNCGYE